MVLWCEKKSNNQTNPHIYAAMSNTNETCYPKKKKTTKKPSAKFAAKNTGKLGERKKEGVKKIDRGSERAREPKRDTVDGNERRTIA